MTMIKITNREAEIVMTEITNDILQNDRWQYQK
jgi:hypothetical protein